MKYRLKRFAREVVNACLWAILVAEISILAIGGLVDGYMRGAGLG